MLFAYRYVPHKMEKMQQFIDFIFFAVWCKAPVRGRFGLHLFACNAQLHQVMWAFSLDDSKGANFFYGHIERIYKVFAALPTRDRHAIHRLKRWYRDNNAIERVCAADRATHLTRYINIGSMDSELSKQLGSFFKDLYSHVSLAALRAKIGDIDDHYRTFAKTNTTGKCPFCGISDLLGPDHNYREAYDHYLPKAIYPFNSINFHNLVPACHHCNSTYKGAKDMAYAPKDPCGVQARRKMFYPFSTEPYRIELTISLRYNDPEHLKPTDVAFQFGPPELIEQIETWKDVYGIEERYRAKLRGEDARDWLEQTLVQQRWHDESQGAKGRPTSVYLEEVAAYTRERPWANANFLKHGFLQACASAGIFDKTSDARTV